MMKEGGRVVLWLVGDLFQEKPSAKYKILKLRRRKQS